MKAETPVAVRAEPDWICSSWKSRSWIPGRGCCGRERGPSSSTSSSVLGCLSSRNYPAPAPPSRRAVEEFKKAVSLVAPPRELTQKEPNRPRCRRNLRSRTWSRSRISGPRRKPLFVRLASQPTGAENSRARSASGDRAGGSSGTRDDTAAAAGSRTSANQTRRGEAELTFETPGGSSGNHPSTATGTGRIPLPKAGVEDAIRGAIRSGPGGVSVGDNTDEPNLANPAMQQPGATGRPASSLELLSDPMGVDFKPYLIRVLAAVRRNWFAVIPEERTHGATGPDGGTVRDLAGRQSTETGDRDSVRSRRSRQGGGRGDQRVNPFSAPARRVQRRSDPRAICFLV